MTVLEKDMFVQVRLVNGKNYACKHNDVFLLDELGFEVWELIDGEKTVEDIASIISENYNEDYKCVLSDLEKFVKQLTKLKLLDI